MLARASEIVQHATSPIQQNVQVLIAIMGWSRQSPVSVQLIFAVNTCSYNRHTSGGGG